MSVAVKRELSQVEPLIKDLTTTSFKAEQPTVHDRATKEYGESLRIHAGPFSDFKQQPQAAKVSTDLVFETWATELNNDPNECLTVSQKKPITPH